MLGVLWWMFWVVLVALALVTMPGVPEVAFGCAAVGVMGSIVLRTLVRGWE